MLNGIVSFVGLNEIEVVVEGGEIMWIMGEKFLILMGIKIF